MGSFWGWGTHVIEQLLFSMFSSIVNFDFNLILGSFLTFLGPNGLIFGVGLEFKGYFWVYSCS